MPYIRPFDIDTPADSDWASEGAERIRELKLALVERLNTVFNNFPDGDPIELRDDAVSQTLVAVGDDDDKPTIPEESGLLFWARDTERLYIAQEGDPNSWFMLNPDADDIVLSGTLENRPAADENGLKFYWTTDEGELFFSNNVSWRKIYPVEGEGGGGEPLEYLTRESGPHSFTTDNQGEAQVSRTAASDVDPAIWYLASAEISINNGSVPTGTWYATGILTTRSVRGSNDGGITWFFNWVSGFTFNGLIDTEYNYIIRYYFLRRPTAE